MKTEFTLGVSVLTAASVSGYTYWQGGYETVTGVSNLTGVTTLGYIGVDFGVLIKFNGSLLCRSMLGG